MSGQLKVAAAVVGTLLGVKLLRHRRYASSAPVTATGSHCSRPSAKTRSRVRSLKPALPPLVLSEQCQLPSSWGAWLVRELRLLAFQLLLAWVAAVSAYALRGRALAEDITAVSLLLIAFLMAVSLVAAATSALWQVGRHRLQPQRWEDLQQRRWQRLPGQPQELGAALAAGQALLADLGGPKVALAEAAPLPLPAPQPLTGVWDKDKEASDSMEPAIRAMRLNPLVRRGVALVRGLELKVTDEEFEMAVFSAIPWFKVVERYPLSGEERSFKRRDLRRGGHVGHCEVVADGRIRLHVAWGEPLGGTGSDTFFLAAPGVLLADTVLSPTNGPCLRYTTVYRRRGGSADGPQT